MIAPDGSIWSVQDHDIIAFEVYSLMSFGKIIPATRFSQINEEPNPHMAEMEGFGELTKFTSMSPAFPMYKVHLLNMGFVRGAMTWRLDVEDVPLSFNFVTPLSSRVKRTMNDFLVTFDESITSVTFDANISYYERFTGRKDARKLKAFIRRFLKDRHYGPGPHPGTGTSQDVHGSDAASGAVEAVATRKDYFKQVMESWDRM